MPLVSVIVPVYNEQSTVYQLLEGIRHQTFPSPDLEVILADGMSTDGTRAEIARFQTDHPELAVWVVENTRRVIPSGLNRAIEAAKGEYILRLDGHSIPAADYIARCVEGLRSGVGDNVGGAWDIRPGGPGWAAQAIALAAAHPFGVGDAAYRHADQAGEVDTVPFGAYRRDVIEALGKYDESLLTNEDYELNVRIRQSGRRVWLDPRIRSTYFARSTFTALARQYFRYGFWKQRMLRRYASTLRWRQALPPLFVLSLLGLALLALFLPLARFLLLLVVVVYLIVLLAGAAPIAASRKAPAMLIGIPAAIAVMHLAWGSGFWISMVRKS